MGPLFIFYKELSFTECLSTTSGILPIPTGNSLSQVTHVLEPGSYRALPDAESHNTRRGHIPIPLQGYCSTLETL